MLCFTSGRSCGSRGTSTVSIFYTGKRVEGVGKSGLRKNAKNHFGRYAAVKMDLEKTLKITSAATRPYKSGLRKTLKLRLQPKVLPHGRYASVIDRYHIANYMDTLSTRCVRHPSSAPQAEPLRGRKSGLRKTLKLLTAAERP